MTNGSENSDIDIFFFPIDYLLASLPVDSR